MPSWPFFTGSVLRGIWFWFRQRVRFTNERIRLPHSSSTAFQLYYDLRTSRPHVLFSRLFHVDRLRRPLEATYMGPFKVLARPSKCFTITLPSGSSEVVSIDHLKPTVLPSDTSSSSTVSSSPTSPDLSPRAPCSLLFPLSLITLNFIYFTFFLSWQFL